VEIAGIPYSAPLVAQSDTSFLGANGYVYDFVSDGAGVVTHVVEHHVSGSYPLQRRP